MSFITDETKYDKYTTYGALFKTFNQSPYTHWSWMYIKNTRENFLIFYRKHLKQNKITLNTKIADLFYAN